MQISLRSKILTASLFALLLAVPLLSHAQSTSNTSLEAAIRAQLLLDPRSANMNPQQFDALVKALTSEAQQQGMTPQQINWKPEVHQGLPQVLQPISQPTCDTFMCSLLYALGLSGNDVATAIWLGIAAAFIVLAGGWLIMRHRTQSIPVVLK